MAMDSTRTLIFGIFVLAGRKLTATQVIALARPAGVLPTTVKSQLTRMIADGALRRAGPVRRARYWPSPMQSAVVEGIVARLEEPSSKPWDGSWLVLTLRLPANRARRERLRAALWFDGFRPWAPNTFVRPAWPKHWALSRARKHLSRAGGLCVCGTPLDSMKDADVSAIYGLDFLDHEARTLARRIRGMRLPTGSAAGVFAARLTAGGPVARLIGHDPRLPAALWGKRKGMRELVREYRRFELRSAPAAQRFLESVVRQSSALKGREVSSMREKAHSKQLPGQLRKISV
jgi:DNA-binding transcriptional regulator PaaX